MAESLDYLKEMTKHLRGEVGIIMKGINSLEKKGANIKLMQAIIKTRVAIIEFQELLNKYDVEIEIPEEIIETIKNIKYERL